MNKRFFGLIALGIGFVVVPSACSSNDVTFFVRDGVCYRKEVDKTAGCSTHTNTHQAVNSNCGLPDK